MEAILVAWVMGKTREEIGNIMEMTREINVFIIIVSNTAPRLRPLANVAKVVKNFGNTLPMTENELCAIIVSSKIVAAGF